MKNIWTNQGCLSGIKNYTSFLDLLSVMVHIHNSVNVFIYQDICTLILLFGKCRFNADLNLKIREESISVWLLWKKFDMSFKFFSE